MLVRRLSLALSAGVLLGLMPAVGWADAPAPAAQAAPAAPVSKAPASPEARAAAAAESTGKPVEVTERRTATEQVIANPDGTTTAKVSARPVRVQRADRSWVAADPSLRRSAGKVVPAATVPGLSFSAGGTGPFATMTQDGRSLSMSWPGTLPAPRIAGDTATYADVLPGVDLKVTSDVEGFSEQLVVRTKAALASVRTVRFGLSVSKGLEAKVAADGSLSVVTARGGAVFRSPPPVLWDTPASAAAVAAGVPGPHRSELGVRLVGGTLELTPDPAALAAPDLKLPLTIDPSWTTKGPAWTEVNSFSPDSATWRTVPTSLAVGYQNFQPATRVRSFIRFPISSTIYGTQIRSATLRLFENWSSSCTARTMAVYATGSFSSSTTWNHQPAWGTLQGTQAVAHGYSSACPAAGVEFNVAKAVAAAAAAHGNVTLGLKATDENDNLAWKKFQVDGTTPQLTIVYNRPPRTPAAADMSTSNPTTSCSGNPRVNAQNGVLLKVKASDPDGDKVKVVFMFQHVGGSSLTTTSAAITSGGTASWQIPATSIAQGQSYSWKAYVRDLDATTQAFVSSSGWSPSCTFIHDGTRPSQPAVTSAEFPENEYRTTSGRTGTFTFAPGATADTDITGYYYGIDQFSPTTYVAAAATDKKATVPATPETWGPHDMVVQTRDSAGNLSTPYPYHFYVKAPTGAVGYWKFDDEPQDPARAVGTVEIPGEPAVPDATLSGGATWTTGGRVGNGLRLDGINDAASTPVRVNTAADLTVSAWVQLTACCNTMTLVSQDGAAGSGFLLQWRAEQRKFAFSMPRQDGASAVLDTAWSTSVLDLRSWYHVTGVYRAADQKLLIYVNGTAEGPGATRTTPWDAPGTVQIGADRAAGVRGDYLAATVDEVRVYDRVLIDSEIADIVSYSRPGPVAVWRMDDGASSTSAADTSGAVPAHPVTRGTGSNFTGGGHDNGCMNLNGAAPATAASVVDTTKTFSVSAWVKLSNKSATYALLSQTGTKTTRYVLAWHGGIDRWVFNLNSADAATWTVATAASTSVPVIGQWTLLAATWDATTNQAKLYVNGRLESTVATSPGWASSAGTLIGASKANGVISSKYVGLIDEIRVYDRAFYAGEAADLYRDGRNLANLAAPDALYKLDEASGTTVSDASGRNHPMTTSGAAGTTAFAPTGGRTGGALTFNPTTTTTPDGDVVVTGGGEARTAGSAMRADRSFAISAWVKLDDTDREQSVVSQDSTDASAFSLSYVPENGGVWRFTLPPGDAAGSEAVEPADAIAYDNAGTWVHLIAEYNSFTGRTRLWVADNVDTRVGFGRQPDPWLATGQMILGRDKAFTDPDADGVRTVGAADWLDGSVDHVAVYVGSLSDADVVVLRNQ